MIIRAAVATEGLATVQVLWSRWSSRAGMALRSCPTVWIPFAVYVEYLAGSRSWLWTTDPLTIRWRS